MQFGGVIYSDSADKATRFIANCNQKNIPLVFLQDVTGFMVGSRSEQGGQAGFHHRGDIGDDLTWVVKDLDGFQVLGRNAAGETQYRYFQSGTYTVALEAWGGSYYVTVSNEVTINC